METPTALDRTWVRLDVAALSNLEGLMRTFVESLCADSVQRKAASDIAAQLVWSKFGNDWHPGFTHEQWEANQMVTPGIAGRRRKK